MSFAQDRTAELWRSFQGNHRAIANAVSTRFPSVNAYGPAFDFGPRTPFEKWAAVEVAEVENLPAGLEAFTLPGGRYAVFRHRRPASGGPRVFGYIFGSWLPASGCALDDRPHFEMLGPGYRPDDPEAEIFIPVRPNARWYERVWLRVARLNELSENQRTRLAVPRDVAVFPAKPHRSH